MKIFGRKLRELWRALFGRKPTAIPGKYPWTISTKNPLPYGTVLFEDANFVHVADGAGGIVSRPKRRLSVSIPRRRAF